MRYVLGIDEAGRGPLAGPVAVGVVLIPEGFDIAQAFPGVRDSKKLSEKRREEIFSLLEEHDEVRYTVEFESADTIDKEGIVPAIAQALARGIRKLAPEPELVKVFLDGALFAPSEYIQETIIKGDELIPAISLASVAAKVIRDRHMLELATTYPQYHFEKHKGYGTKLHYELLKEHGFCDIHRKSFLHIDSVHE